jgi:hypothetical protein
MTNALGQLMLAIPKVADGDEGLRKSFVVLATSAQASLKLVEGSQTPESLSKAGQDLEMLKHALAEAMEQAKLRAQAQAGAGPVVYAKSRLAWLATRKRLESDISRLESEIVATYEDEGVGQDLASAYATWVGPMLSALDDRLANALDAAANATNAVERTKLVADAKTLIAQYTAFLNSDPRIAELDDNPFLPLAIRSTVGGTLSTLAKAIV